MKVIVEAVGILPFSTGAAWVKLLRSQRGEQRHMYISRAMGKNLFYKGRRELNRKLREELPDPESLKELRDD